MALPNVKRALTCPTLGRQLFSVFSTLLSWPYRESEDSLDLGSGKCSKKAVFGVFSGVSVTPQKLENGLDPA